MGVKPWLSGNPWVAHLLLWLVLLGLLFLELLLLLLGELKARDHLLLTLALVSLRAYMVQDPT